MNKSKIVSIVLLVAGLSGCQSPTQRNPDSVIIPSAQWEELRVLKQRKVELGALSVHYDQSVKTKKNSNELIKINAEKTEIDTKIAQIETAIDSFETSKSQYIKHPKADWRIENEKIELRKLDYYTLDKNVEFSVSTYEAKETKVSLTHWLFSHAGITLDPIEPDRPEMNFKIKCDAPFTIKKALKDKKVKANETYKIAIADKKLTGDSIDFVLHSDFNSCEFNFTSSKDPSEKVYGFKVVNETKKLKPLEELLSTTGVCTLKRDTGKFFETNEFLNMTCPQKYESIEILPEPIDSLNARIRSLLGTDLPKDFIKNGNPYAELDFSKAPKFDAILISYLVFRADFYGTLMARILAHHADKGALVRIIVSGVITLKKDENLYEKLMAQHPNIKVIQYQFDNKQKGGGWISELHRTNHVKLFITYSKNNPKDSSVIVGGKNIHDGFVFKTPVDVSRYPEIVNYVSGDESWAYWRDFEMVIRGQDFVENIVRHYMNYYHINKKNLVMKLPSIAVQKESALDSEEKSMRHYVSIPFKDEPNLNLFYARLIDSAKNKILISTPYFRPVKEIAAALESALKRGVDITIITRLDLEGDTADFILGAVNKDGVNQYLHKIKVFEYTEPKVILHSKLLMIDDEVSFISSVNLNKRSFYHDLENGVVVNDRKFTLAMDKLYKEYMTISRQITEKQKIIFWQRWIIKVFDKMF